MKQFDWNHEKNEWLRAERGITFEEIVYHIQHGGLLDVIGHFNQELYPNQRIFIVNVEGYACLVPFVETDEGIFLKTIIPSRKMTKLYLRGEQNETN
jgi:uncharacterized DUF497 family protein